MRNFRKKYFRFCANCAKKKTQKNSAKPRKTHCVPCAKIAQKFAKKKNLRKFCAKDLAISWKPYTYILTVQK